MYRSSLVKMALDDGQKSVSNWKKVWQTVQLQHKEERCECLNLLQASLQKGLDIF